MVVYTCPQCLKEFTLKSNILRHFNRKFKCSVNGNDGVELNDDIIQKVLDRSYNSSKENILISTSNIVQNIETQNNIQKHENVQNIQNIITNIMIGGTSLLTHESIVNLIKPIIQEAKYGRYSQLDKHIIDDDRTKLSMQDVYMMTDRLTKTTDDKTFLDAYYLYDYSEKRFMMRFDKVDDDGYQHKWHWRICEYDDIYNDILHQLQENVFVDIERKYNSEYMETHSTENLINLYKILKCCKIKPLCKSARNDNQLIYMSLDPEYDNCADILVCDTLEKLYDDTNVNIEEYIMFVDTIKDTIRSNGASTFEMIKNKILEFAKLTM